MQLRTSNSQQSPNNVEAQSLRCSRHRARKPSFFVLAFYALAAAATANAQQQQAHYVFNGATLEVADGTHAFAKYGRWQIWLYQGGVRIPHYAAGLEYSRWGLMEGGSSESVKEQLRNAQRFEEVYLTFFGAGTWGRYTFSNPLGPIAVMGEAIENDPTALETRYQLDGLRGRVNRLIVSAQPSLENNEGEGPSSPHKEYFDQIRDALQQVSKLYSQLARPHHEAHYISEVIARTDKAVTQAGKILQNITASLPSVKLPVSTTWMFHTEGAGRDGTIHVEVRETGSVASVQQTWTGGDGSMTGTVTVTTIPFDDIGKIELEPPLEKGYEMWTVSVQSSRNLFPETMSSPVRSAPKRVLPSVNLTTTRSLVYFTFRNFAEAQDAYAYFLYHKQRGR
jgi:hypothetical protein